MYAKYINANIILNKKKKYKVRKVRVYITYCERYILCMYKSLNSCIYYFL